MASQYPPDQDEHHLHHHLPQSLVLAHHQNYIPSLSPDPSYPPSPTAIAAATALAQLSDNRPPTTAGEDEEDMCDDDDTGGISITQADLQYSAANDSVPLQEETHNQQLAEDDVESIAALINSLPPILYTSHADLDPGLDSFDFDSFLFPVQANPVMHLATSFSTSSHLPSYEHSLEPPPTLHEAQLNIVDRGSFDPITSFFHELTSGKPTVPGLDLIEVPKSVTREQLQGDRYDCQGIDWVVRNTTRAHIRAKKTEHEIGKVPRTSQYLRRSISVTPNKDDFFRFRRNNMDHRAFFPHFQLRNVLAATSRNDIYYASGQRVFHTDANGAPQDEVLNLSKRLAPDGSITTIASAKDVLIAGAFEGEYAITDLSSTHGTPCTFGRTSHFAADTKSRIVNHMHLYESRHTHVPQAVLCSNDHRLRVLDCATNTFTHSYLYSAAVNSAATSPDGRMRVVVGDFQETLITNAETGQPFVALNSHTDDAFACAWADDGIHVATAAQDSAIIVWDARNWSKPLSVMTSEVSVPRSLHFSPIGSGPRVLIAAEADDYINIINAQTFASKQVFEFFGSVGGAAFTPDGQSLFIANGERRFGGIIELERTGWAQRRSRKRKSADSVTWDEILTDWGCDADMNQHGCVLIGDIERRRRGVELEDVFV